jgi:hypothetical protein
MHLLLGSFKSLYHADNMRRRQRRTNKTQNGKGTVRSPQGSGLRAQGGGGKKRENQREIVFGFLLMVFSF